MTDARVVLATRNRHKVEEFRSILAEDARLPDTVSLASAIVGLPDNAPDVVENGVTFEENALLKARAAARFTGLPAIADDSGLSVDVLGGAPGIFSARWAGRHGNDRRNLELLLNQLADVKDEHRGARFVCAMALVLPDGTQTVRLGAMPGTLAREPRGTNGFGYDPILVPDSQPGGGGLTSAELSPQEKNTISHRGAATRAMVEALLATLTSPGQWSAHESGSAGSVTDDTAR